MSLRLIKIVCLVYQINFEGLFLIDISILLETNNAAEKRLLLTHKSYDAACKYHLCQLASVIKHDISANLITSQHVAANTTHCPSVASIVGQRCRL